MCAMLGALCVVVIAALIAPPQGLSLGTAAFVGLYNFQTKVVAPLAGLPRWVDGANNSHVNAVQAREVMDRAMLLGAWGWIVGRNGSSPVCA